MFTGLHGRKSSKELLRFSTVKATAATSIFASVLGGRRDLPPGTTAAEAAGEGPRAAPAAADHGVTPIPAAAAAAAAATGLC